MQKTVRATSEQEMPSEETVSNVTSSAYSEEQFSDNYPIGMEKHYWIVARNKILQRHIQRFFSPSDVILDIGCGTGVVVDYLTRHSIPCYGVELGKPTVIGAAKDRIYGGCSVRDLPEEFRRSITSVLLLDVLEHLQSPHDLFNEIRTFIPNVKRAIVTVPARQELWSNYDEHFGHYLRYSKSQLKELIESIGGSVAKIKYFFHCLYLPMLLLSMFGFKRTTSNKAPRRLFLQTALAFLFNLREQIISERIVGASLIAHITWLEGLPCKRAGGNRLHESISLNENDGVN